MQYVCRIYAAHWFITLTVHPYYCYSYKFGVEIFKMIFAFGLLFVGLVSALFLESNKIAYLNFSFTVAFIEH